MRKLFTAMVLACALTCGWPGSSLLDVPAAGVEVANLQQQLESGLKARRPEEFAFIQMVVTKVANNQLPLDLVKSTFLWARKNPDAKEYPFVYFERGLRERAKKLGITI